MFTFFLCIALIDLGIGYYLGRWLLVRTLPQSVMVENKEPAPEIDGQLSASEELRQDPLPAEHSDRPNVTANSAAKHSGPPPKASWNASGNDLKSDIATINDRIRYAFAANDKQLVRDIAAELRTRSRLWSTQLQKLLTELNAQLKLDPAAKIDCATPELCLAQIETLQTNLELLDWTETADSILEKLGREVEAVKKVLPANMNAS